jgi:hypothetical protein
MININNGEITDANYKIKINSTPKEIKPWIDGIKHKIKLEEIGGSTYASYDDTLNDGTPTHVIIKFNEQGFALLSLRINSKESTSENFKKLHEKVSLLLKKEPAITKQRARIWHESWGTLEVAMEPNAGEAAIFMIPHDTPRQKVISIHN